MATDLVYHHSQRGFVFGSLRGPEVLYPGATFHDHGRTDTYHRTDQRFEIDAAGEARRFLGDYGITGEAAARVWSGIALHTTLEIPLHLAPEIALFNRGVELDVLSYFVAGFKRGDFVEIIQESDWPE